MFANQLVLSADRVEVAVTYQIINRFQSLVGALSNLVILDEAIQNSRRLLEDVRSRYRGFRQELSTRHMPIARKQRRKRNKEAALVLVERLYEMKQAYFDLNDELQAQNYAAAVSRFVTFRSSLAAISRARIAPIFQRLDLIIGSNLKDSLRSSFESVLFNYLSTAFDCVKIDFSTSTPMTSIPSSRSLNLSRSFNLENEELPDFLAPFSRQREVEARAVELLTHFISTPDAALTNLTLRLSQTIDPLAKRLLASVTSSLNSRPSAEPLVLSHFLAIFEAWLSPFSAVAAICREAVHQLVLGGRKKPEERQVELEQPYSPPSQASLAALETLFTAAKTILRRCLSDMKTMISVALQRPPSDRDVLNLGHYLRQMDDWWTKRTMMQLLPKRLSCPKPLDALLRRLVSQSESEDFGSFRRQLGESLLSAFHSKKCQMTQRLVEIEPWSEVNLPVETQERLRMLFTSNRYTLAFSGPRLTLNGRVFFISRSLEALFASASIYQQARVELPEFSNLVSELAAELLGFYNRVTFSIILEGGCVEFGVIKRIDTHLLLALSKELQLLSLLASELRNAVAPELTSKLESVVSDIQTHRDNLRVNILALLRSEICENIDLLKELAWSDPRFTHHAPSAEVSAVFLSLSDASKAFSKFLTVEETRPFFEGIRTIVSRDFARTLNVLAAQSANPANKQSLAQEAAFVLEGLANLEAESLKAQTSSAPLN